MTTRRIKRFLMSAVRTRIVWLWLAGCRARDISIRTGTSISTVYRWLRRWQKACTVTKGLSEGTEVSSAYLDLFAHLNLQFQMYALTTAQGQDMDSYYVLKNILMGPVY